MGTAVGITGKQVRDEVLYQSRNWPEYVPIANSGCALPIWSLRSPLLHEDASDTYDEIDDVVEEIIPSTMVEGCYDLRATTQIGDRWVDLGSHVGVFSIAAMMRGATTALLVDMDPDVLRRALWNVQNFSRLVEAMQGIPQGSILSPMTSAVEVNDAYDVEDLVQSSGLAGPLCLKMDIQGGEIQCVLGGGASVLATRFSKILMEWHDEKLVSSALVALENAGYGVMSMRRHRDVLLGIDTHIIFAAQERLNGNATQARVVDR